MRKDEKVTIITDRQIQDGISIDKYCQFVYHRGVTIAGIREMVQDGRIHINCPIVVLLLGNNQIPWAPNTKPKAQIRKLVQAIFVKYRRDVKKVWIGTVIPRPDREIELEEEIKSVNKGFSGAVKELKRHTFEMKRTEFLPVHRIFLERYIHVDVLTGHTAYHYRIVKPVSKYFVAGKSELNPIGLYHLKSFIVQTVGIMQGINDWTGIPDRKEPQAIQDQKKAAWILTHAGAQSNSTLSLVQDSDTDVEDEKVDLVQLREDRIGFEKGKSCIPVFGCVGAKLVADRSPTM